MRCKWHNKEQKTFGLVELSDSDKYILKCLGCKLIDKEGFVDSKNGRLIGEIVQIWKQVN